MCWRNLCFFVAINGLQATECKLSCNRRADKNIYVSYSIFLTIPKIQKPENSEYQTSLVRAWQEALDWAFSLQVPLGLSLYQKCNKLYSFAKADQWWCWHRLQSARDTDNILQRLRPARNLLRTYIIPWRLNGKRENYQCSV